MLRSACGYASLLLVVPLRAGMASGYVGGVGFDIDTIS